MWRDVVSHVFRRGYSKHDIKLVSDWQYKQGALHILDQLEANLRRKIVAAELVDDDFSKGETYGLHLGVIEIQAFRREVNP